MDGTVFTWQRSGTLAFVVSESRKSFEVANCIKFSELTAIIRPKTLLEFNLTAKGSLLFTPVRQRENPCAPSYQIVF